MAKIWQINETFTQNETIGWSVEFTSNGRNFISFGCETYLMYGYTNTSGQTELLYLTTPSNGIHTWKDPNTGEDTSAYRTVAFETEPTGDLLAWLQANAVAQDQPTVTTTRVLYKGKKELTMAQFEALSSLDDAVDYDITDFPNGGITNAQMTAALGYSRLFEDGEIYVCSDTGTYTKGHTYQVKVTSGVKSWEDITPASGDLQNYVPKQSEAEPVALTWRFNDTVDTNRDNDFLVNFTSNGINFTEMGFKWSMQQPPAPKDTMYYSSPTKFQDVYYGQWSGDTDQYRTVTFETEPSGDLLTWLQSNAVPQSETTTGSKIYAQVTNENGAVSIRVFENSDADLQNLSITKDGVTINGKKPLTSVQPLYKHELVIPYSFSVTDSANETTTVDGSAIYHYLSNTGTQITSASEIDDNFLLSGGIGKNSANTTALTWVINEKPSVPDKMFSVKFTSDNIRYNTIILSPTGDAVPGGTGVLIAYHQEDGNFDQVYEIYQGTERWGSQAYRTLTFETAPTGELLTWLQENAVPQSEVDPNTTLTWQLNDTLTLFGMETKQFDINFVSNNQSFKAMYFALNASPIMKYLTDVDTKSGITPYSENFGWMGYDDTDHSAFRTITFETAPTGELLTWLQANAVPQGGADSNTVLLFNVNVTKAGSSITVEAVNASTMGYITGTVGTITDTVTQLI